MRNIEITRALLKKIPCAHQKKPYRGIYAYLHPGGEICSRERFNRHLGLLTPEEKTTPLTPSVILPLVCVVCPAYLAVAKT